MTSPRSGKRADCHTRQKPNKPFTNIRERNKHTKRETKSADPTHLEGAQRETEVSGKRHYVQHRHNVHLSHKACEGVAVQAALYQFVLQMLPFHDLLPRYQQWSHRPTAPVLKLIWNSLCRTSVVIVMSKYKHVSNLLANTCRCLL